MQAVDVVQEPLEIFRPTVWLTKIRVWSFLRDGGTACNFLLTSDKLSCRFGLNVCALNVKLLKRAAGRLPYP